MIKLTKPVKNLIGQKGLSCPSAVYGHLNIFKYEMGKLNGQVNIKLTIL